jgi:glycosyltransferase involved in cell wall biosynthesis
MTTPARVVYAVLSGDAPRAVDWLRERFPEAELCEIGKDELRRGSRLATLRRLRQARTDVFVLFSYSNPWQLGRSMMLLYGWTAGARRCVMADAWGGWDEFGAARLWLRELPRTIVEVLLAAPLLLGTVAASIVLGLLPARRSRVSSANRFLISRPTPTSGAVEGGEAAHLRGVASGLAALGRSVHVLTNDPIPALSRAGHEVVVRSPGSFFNSVPLAFELWQNLAYSRHLWSEVRRLRPSVLYQRYSRNNWSGALVAGLTGVPLVLEWNGSEAWMALHWAPLRRWVSVVRLLEWVNLRRADLIVVVSRVLEQDLLRRGVKNERILCNPNGVDPQRFRPDAGGEAIRARYGLNGKVVVGFVGSFTCYQGAPVLAAAAARIARDDVHFLFVGQGDTLAEARRIVDAASATDRVTFTGQVPSDEVPAYVAAFDVAVAPLVPNADGSPMFNSPVKAYEYMAAGRAIIASRLGQLEEVLVDGETALLVEPGDAAALAASVERVAADAALRERLGAAARKLALQRHTWRENAARVVSAVER